MQLESCDDNLYSSFAYLLDLRDTLLPAVNTFMNNVLVATMAYFRYDSIDSGKPILVEHLDKAVRFFFNSHESPGFYFVDPNDSDGASIFSFDEDSETDSQVAEEEKLVGVVECTECHKIPFVTDAEGGVCHNCANPITCTVCDRDLDADGYSLKVDNCFECKGEHDVVCVDCQLDHFDLREDYSEADPLPESIMNCGDRHHEFNTAERKVLRLFKHCYNESYCSMGFISNSVDFAIAQPGPFANLLKLSLDRYLLATHSGHVPRCGIPKIVYM